MIDRQVIVGVVLAGGASRRMGGEAKATIRLGGETMLTRAIGRLDPQVATLVINANDEFGSSDRPLARDPFDDRRGPLAGVLAGMDWAAEGARPETARILRRALRTVGTGAA